MNENNYNNVIIRRALPRKPKPTRNTRKQILEAPGVKDPRKLIKNTKKRYFLPKYGQSTSRDLASPRNVLKTAVGSPRNGVKPIYSPNLNRSPNTKKFQASMPPNPKMLTAGHRHPGQPNTVARNYLRQGFIKKVKIKPVPDDPFESQLTSQIGLFYPLYPAAAYQRGCHHGCIIRRLQRVRGVTRWDHRPSFEPFCHNLSCPHTIMLVEGLQDDPHQLHFAVFVHRQRGLCNVIKVFNRVGSGLDFC